MGRKERRLEQIAAAEKIQLLTKDMNGHSHTVTIGKDMAASLIIGNPDNAWNFISLPSSGNVIIAGF